MVASSAKSPWSSAFAACRPPAAADQARSANPEARYNLSDGAADYSPGPQTNAVSAGGPARAVYTNESEPNPFDNEYDNAFEKKGAQIKIAEQERPNIGRARAPSSPQGHGLVRSVTADSAVRGPVEEDKPLGGGGFLNRMKSLKGGSRRVRPERKDSNSGGDFLRSSGVQFTTRACRDWQN